MRKNITHIALLLLLFLGNALAQPCVKVGDAIQLFTKDLEKAKKGIEDAALDAACSSDPATWYYKAFILKDYYKNKEKTIKNAPSRIAAIEAAKKNLQLDPQNRYAEECKKILNFLAQTFYNDASKDLNEKKYPSAYDNYVRYLDIIKYGQPDKLDTSAIFYAGYAASMANNYLKAKEYLKKAVELKYQEPNLYYYLGKVYWSIGEKDKSYEVLNLGHALYPENKDVILAMVQYYSEDGKLKVLESTLDKAIQLDSKSPDLKLTQAVVCEKLSETEKGQEEKYFKKSESLYKEVIKSDANNSRANYNLAILYYNKAVNIIDKLDADSDLITIDKIQDQCVLIFKLSLPYMTKAYQLNPNKKDVLEGLAGIYFALNDIPKSNEFKQKAESMK
jgi:tetratricopeptide (TPR) repeat protein